MRGVRHRNCLGLGEGGYMKKMAQGWEVGAVVLGTDWGGQFM